jgi:hypothetical protein
MTLYSIRDWEKHFEIRDTKRVDGPLKWIAIPTKTDGLGFSLVRLQKNASELLAAWYLMLGVAAKQDRANRGKLARDGVPLTADDLELMTGFPARIFTNAFAFLSQDKPGWLVKEECGKMPQDAAPMRQNAATCGESGIQDRTGQNTTRQDVGPAVAAPASDSEWLDSLASNPAYEGINVRVEHGKMVAWCQANRRQPTRRRFVNWLNRCERPMGAASTSRPTMQPVREPDNWRTFLNHNFPESRFSAGQPDEAHQWSDLDRQTQLWLIQQMRRSA